MRHSTEIGILSRVLSSCADRVDATQRRDIADPSISDARDSHFIKSRLPSDFHRRIVVDPTIDAGGSRTFIALKRNENNSPRLFFVSRRVSSSRMYLVTYLSLHTRGSDTWISYNDTRYGDRETDIRYSLFAICSDAAVSTIGGSK